MAELTKKVFVEMIKAQKPKTARELRGMGFELTRLGSGAFRAVYAINKRDHENRLVIKFPLRNRDYETNLEHARHEIYVIKKINKTKRFAALRPFMPKIWYSDYKNGILLTDFYYPVRESPACVAALILEQVADAIFDDESECGRDISGFNIMKDKYGDYKIIDLGLV